MSLFCAVLPMLAIFAVFAQSGWAEVNCTTPHPTGEITFPFFKCPNNTHCVVSDIGGSSFSSGSNGGINSLIPVGCCPDHLRTHCHQNGTTYSNLLGCCPYESVCCVGLQSGREYLVGCAARSTQCCNTRICEEGYSCCISSKGSTCCPDTTLCRAFDQYLPVNDTNNGLRTARISSFFNISDDQMCIPLDNSGPDFNVTGIFEYPNIVVQYPTPYGIGYYVADIVGNPNVTVCGTQMCHTGDECVHRYRNISKTRVFRNTTAACADAKMMNASYWGVGGCFRVGSEIETASFPAGCCAPGKTPCGAHQHTFTPYEINTHSSPFLYDLISGCTNENETCCYPFICPPETQCCTAQRQVFGKDIDMALLRLDLGNVSFASNNEGHNFCCPAEAFCCEYIPSHALERTVSMMPKSIPFCGTDANCTLNFFGSRRTIYPRRAVRETIPWTDTFFNEELAFRQSLGVVGNTNPYTPNSTELDDTCFYQATVAMGTNPPETIFFDIPCSVLANGNTPSVAGAILAPNVAPAIQIQKEIALGGKIPCPSPTPEVWCESIV